MNEIPLRILAFLRRVREPCLNGLRKMYRQLQCCLYTVEPRQGKFLQCFYIQIKKQVLWDSGDYIDFNGVFQNETKPLSTHFRFTQLHYGKKDSKHTWPRVQSGPRSKHVFFKFIEYRSHRPILWEGKLFYENKTSQVIFYSSRDVFPIVLKLSWQLLLIFLL